MNDPEVFAAKPTLYNGILYRSRLESRFAEWLDSHDADFEYEPGPMGDELYLPDFVCHAARGYNVFVEIKPIRFYQEAWVAIRAAQACQENLMVIDSPARGKFGCYAVVHAAGELLLFTSSKRMMPELGFNKTTRRPIYYFCGPFAETEPPPVAPPPVPPPVVPPPVIERDETKYGGECPF